MKKTVPATTVVALAATKGGVGKTMLTAALAVRASEERGARVAMLDLDPQGSLRNWVGRREAKKGPVLQELDSTAEAIELLVSQGWRYVFMDTSPARLELIEPAIAVSDFVLIPTRPSAADFEQVNVVVEMCRLHGKPFAFILNHAPNGQLAKQTALLLQQLGPVLKPYLAYRQAHMAATVMGATGFEVEKDGRIRAEIDELWASVQEALAHVR